METDLKSLQQDSTHHIILLRYNIETDMFIGHSLHKASQFTKIITISTVGDKSIRKN